MLKAAREAKPRHEARRHPGDVALIEAHAAGARPVDAGDEIEGRRLARPIRADERDDLAATDVEIDVVHRHEAAEALAQPHRFEKLAAPRRRRATQKRFAHLRLALLDLGRASRRAPEGRRDERP